MSTHALVGVRTSVDGFKARYVHSDGYPEHMVPTLNRWIRNYKAAGMQDQNPIDSVMSQHWSSLGTPSKGNHYESFYTESHNIDHEYLYLIDRDTLVVTSYIRQGNGWMEINPNNVIREKATRF